MLKEVVRQSLNLSHTIAFLEGSPLNPYVHLWVETVGNSTVLYVIWLDKRS
jgi:hypothetical protein